MLTTDSLAQPQGPQPKKESTDFADYADLEEEKRYIVTHSKSAQSVKSLDRIFSGRDDSDG
jgi:hypothetical protein